MKYVLFICDWFDVNNRNSGVKVDEYALLFLTLKDSWPQINHTYSFYKSTCVLCGGHVGE